LTAYSHCYIETNAIQQDIPDLHYNNAGHLEVVVDLHSNVLSQLNVIFPLIYFSLLYLQSEQADHPILLKIALNSINYCPGFDALGLWLQRKAFIHLIQTEGIPTTLNHIADYINLSSVNDSSERSFRIELLWYAVMKLNLSKVDIALVVRMLKDHSKLGLSNDR